MTQKRRTLVDTSEVIKNPFARFLYSNLLKQGVEIALGVDKINRLYDELSGRHKTAEAFSEAVFKQLGIYYYIDPEDIKRLQAVKGPLVAVANHPFGGIESLFMVLLLSKVRPDFKVLANFMIDKIEEVRKHLILVDPFDNPESAQRNIVPLKEALRFLREGGLMGVFPAGEVAALNFNSGKIVEPDWNPNISRLIQKTGAQAVPIYFHGYNSYMFQMAGAVHERLRTALLLREFMYPTTKKIRFKIGQVIPAEKIASYKDPQELTNFLKSKTYFLGAGYLQTKNPLNLGNPLKGFVRKRLTPVVGAVSQQLLENDITNLSEDAKLYVQNEMEVYVFKAEQCQALLHEIGRLREVTFRAVGEGSGKQIDLDDHDNDYEHLIIWNCQNKEIVGAYRIGRCDELLKKKGPKGLYINSLFSIDPDLFDRVKPCLELGRSFVRQEYQRNYWSLMLLWIGIGRYLLRHPDYKYLIGPVSISSAFHTVSQNFLVIFLMENYYNHDLTSLVRPKHSFRKKEQYEREFYRNFSIRNFKDIQDIITEVEEDEDIKVPVLLKHYLKLGGQILAFNVDPDFQNAIDALMLTEVPKIEPTILKKYMGDEGYENYMALHRN